MDGLRRRAQAFERGQGFLFAKPMPAAAFAVFVSQWRGATMNANDPTATSCCVCCKEIPLEYWVITALGLTGLFLLSLARALRAFRERS